MLTRRGFIGLFGGLVAHEVVRPIYILPPMGGWNQSASGILTPEHTLALEMEFIRPELEDLVFSSSILWKKIAAPVRITSKSQLRMPFAVRI